VGKEGIDGDPRTLENRKGSFQVGRIDAMMMKLQLKPESM
jgi:hypothetical protein